MKRERTCSKGRATLGVAGEKLAFAGPTDFTLDVKMLACEPGNRGHLDACTEGPELESLGIEQ